MEGLLGHKHLSPHNQPGRGVFDDHGDGADGFEILRHILPHIAVPPGRAPDKPAVFIFQGHGETVDFRLHGERRGRDGLLCTGKKLLQLLHAEHILQAHQRHGMAHLGEGVHRLAAHPPGGRIGKNIFRVFLFQILQLPQETVVFKVRHGRIVQHVIPVARLVKKRRELFHSLFGFHNCLLREKMYRVRPPQ